ncbi:MAG: CRISPR-associated protein Cas4 [Lactimicrobium massiliense]|nr:CRISPR-associated protein Cas4 [Lactimicrobium massiliense]MDD6559977.1 CRISPR-associated protein Cas4 [Lactimicrobium massiliense]
MLEDDYLQLSGIQHFVFCKRQWQLIHIDGVWEENALTIEGDLLHRNAHNNNSTEIRDGILIMHGVSLRSDNLYICGMTDVLEFHPDSKGIRLKGHDGLWVPYPVEYKHGSNKTFDADSLQLCAEAMCMEEMLHCSVKEGALFYGRQKHREQVCFDELMRNNVRSTIKEMFSLLSSGKHVPYSYSKKCDSCSLNNICLPKLKKNVSDYLRGVE